MQAGQSQRKNGNGNIGCLCITPSPKTLACSRAQRHVASRTALQYTSQVSCLITSCVELKLLNFVLYLQRHNCSDSFAVGTEWSNVDLSRTWMVEKTVLRSCTF
jgi:hypothetical protein